MLDCDFVLVDNDSDSHARSSSSPVTWIVTQVNLLVELLRVSQRINYVSGMFYTTKGGSVSVSTVKLRLRPGNVYGDKQASRHQEFPKN